MQVAGSQSWRLTVDEVQSLHVALYVREAGRLAVAPAPDIPPALDAEVPDRSAALPPGSASVAAEQWVTWWRALAGDEARVARTDRAGLPAMFDPPRYDSLAGLAELRALVLAASADALAWTGDPRRGGPADEAAFPWEVVREAAENVADRTGAALGDLDAAVGVLTVRGHWSHVRGAGYALCSAALAAGPDAAGLLAAVFVTART